ncbi:hypothetical protein C8R43DRAFT_1114660 [Mycena crocata]|nr:hypothetical protein C8R43DRAFT_1114660 [Mycena crocata]
MAALSEADVSRYLAKVSEAYHVSKTAAETLQNEAKQKVIAADAVNDALREEVEVLLHANKGLRREKGKNHQLVRIYCGDDVILIGRRQIEQLKETIETTETNSNAFIELASNEVKQKDAANDALREEFEVLQRAYKVLRKKTKNYEVASEKIEQLEGTIESMETNYSNALIEELESEIEKLRDEREKEAAFQASALSLPDLMEYMSLRPSPPKVRSFGSLKTVCNPLATSKELQSYFYSKPALWIINSSDILFLPGLTAWSSKKRLHAVAFLPVASYDSKMKTWSNRSGFDQLAGKKELFIEDHRDKSKLKSILYAGVYERRALSFSGTVDKEIATATRALAAPGIAPEKVKEMFETAFPGQPWKVDVVGLQCVGFNRDLNKELRKQFSDDSMNDLMMLINTLTDVGKRKAEDESDEQNVAKRRRTDSVPEPLNQKPDEGEDSSDAENSEIDERPVPDLEVMGQQSGEWEDSEIDELPLVEVMREGSDEGEDNSVAEESEEDSED